MPATLDVVYAKDNKYSQSKPANGPIACQAFATESMMLGGSFKQPNNLPPGNLDQGPN